MSGNSSTLSPLGRRYSVMPSTTWTFLMALTGIGLPSFGAPGMGVRFTLLLGVMTRPPGAGSSPLEDASGGGSFGCAAGWPLGGVCGVPVGGSFLGVPGGLAGGVSPAAGGAGVALVAGWPAGDCGLRSCALADWGVRVASCACAAGTA